MLGEVWHRMPDVRKRVHGISGQACGVYLDRVCIRTKRPISARTYSGFCSFRTDYKHVSAYATLHSNPNLKTGTRKLKIPDEALLLPVEIKVLYQCKYRHIFNSRTWINWHNIKAIWKLKMKTSKCSINGHCLIIQFFFWTEKTV